MKLERLPEYLTATVVTLLGIGFAVYSGKLTGEGQVSSLLMLLGAAAGILLILKMRANIWLLIPLFMPITGQIIGLPLSLPVRDIAIAFVFGAFLVLKALKIVRGKQTYDWLDLVLLVNLLYLLSVYIRNPVGTESLNSERIGGRPYFEIAFAGMAYWVMGNVTITPLIAKRLPILMILGTCVDGFFNFITTHFPETTPIIGRFYSGISPEAYIAENSEGERNMGPVEGRESYLAGIGTGFTTLLCSYFAPISLFNPLRIGRFLLMGFAVFAVLKSGHRNAVITIPVAFLLSSYFRGGKSEVFRLTVLGIPLVATVLLLQGNVLELPSVAQRSLSFLPGKWEPAIIDQTRGSNEWRFEIWKRVMTTDKYITNKWLGDGFGFTQAQWAAMRRSTDKQENLTISGDYHSGPLSTIHIVGYVGLVFFYCLIIGMAFMAWKVIKRAKHTSYFPLALLVGISVIPWPLFFTVIFGAYNNDLPSAIFNVAYLKLIRNSLAQHEISGSQKPDRNPLPEKPGALPTLLASRGMHS